MAASQIDLAKPVGNWRQAIETRQNFEVAASEISALQDGGSGAIGELQQQVATLQTQVADLTSRVTVLENAAADPPTPEC